MSWLVTPAEKTPVDRFGINSVSLLLHGNGTNGSTSIIDSSPTPKAITVFGNAQISTAQSRFGSSSIAFDGTGDWLEAPASLSYFGTGDFTIELWVYRNNSVNSGIFEARRGVVAEPWVWYFNATKLEFYNGSSIVTTATVPTLQWVHVALSRSSGVLRQFINGNKDTENTVTTNLNTSTSATQLMRLRDGATFSGYVSEYRVTTGVARYTANFTPPTAPFPDI